MHSIWHENKHRLALSTGIELGFGADNCVDGWRNPDAVILMHGISENGTIWRPWVPHLARNFVVIRPDLRGYDQSSPLISTDPSVAANEVTIEKLADDIEALVGQLGLKRVHLVGAKLGALIGIELAQRQLPWVVSLTLAGMLVSPKKLVTSWHDEWIDLIDKEGVEAWARLTMPGRMGSALSPEAVDWWAKFMGTARPNTVKACMRMVEKRSEPAGLERILCPTLVITSGGTASTSSAFNQKQSIDDMTSLQKRIRHSTFTPIMNADSYYIAGTHPDLCSERAAAFMLQQKA